MTKPFETIYNVLTGETTIREFTDQEIAQREIEISENAKLLAEQQAANETKEKAKATILAKLGITEDEAKLLLS